MVKDQLWRIRVFGIVQGVGFRPTVSRHAEACHIRGNVSNVGPYVEIWAKGVPADLERFLDKIEQEPPQRAVILKLKADKKSPELMEFSNFQIIESEKRQGDIFVSPDIAICPACKKELYDPSDRRYLHPFINCTCCGPRLTILDGMPYDRIRTSMADFPMCTECEYEYSHSETRRYDAQPVCCNDCGPEVYLLDRPERGPGAIREARAVIRRGGIVGVKGIGGFHLCCDATSEEAVALLRKRKMRPVKPFAVMMKNMDAVRRECLITPMQEQIVDGHQKPILLLPKKKGGKVVPLAAPGNPKLGVMLPYAPVQLLLFDYRDDAGVPDCLIMTSANTSGAPICRDDNDARKELGHLCDVILSHNRLIRIRADDSVMDFYDGEPYMIRRSRGYAPLPVMLKEEFQGEVLGIGGELKNTFCIGKNQLFYPSPYIGDMEDVRTAFALEESISRLEELLEANPSVVACDLHPGYNTTEIAQRLGIPVYKVQHHYAHILSCMAENDYNGPVLGVSFDGTGYGSDGTIWGGEMMLADYKGFYRYGSVQPFWHVGGDTASREGWRIAVSIIFSIYGRDQGMSVIERLGLCDRNAARIQYTMVDRRINSIVSTSAGRLFDAVSAILDIRRNSTYEGEASTFLEFAAELYEESRKESDENRPEIADRPVLDTFLIIKKLHHECGEECKYFELKTFEIIRFIIEGYLSGEEKGKLAFLFHQKLAEAIVQGCTYMRRLTGVNTTALSGGVFQNQLLLRLTTDLLKKSGFHVLTHHLIPPNDGGICLGQAVAAMHWIQNKENI